jgi:hypothetical protein
MSDHEIDLLEQTARKLAWIARGMAALVVMGFGAGAGIATQQAQIATLTSKHEVMEARQDKAENRLESYQIATNQKFEALLASQSQVLIAVAEMRAEMRALTDRIDRSQKNGP